MKSFSLADVKGRANLRSMSWFRWGPGPDWRARAGRALGIASGILVGCSGGVSQDVPHDAAVSCPADAPEYSVEFAEVSGRLTKNGVAWEPLPELQFVLRDGIADDSRYGRSALANGDGRFTARLPFGTHDVRVFMGSRTDLVSGVVPQGLVVNGPAYWEIDFETVLVSGEVRLAGAAFPGAESNRGSVCLGEAAGDRNSFCATLSGGAVASYSLEVPRGRVYEMTWVRGDSLPSDAPLNDVPYGQQSFAVRAFDRDTVVDLDVSAPSLVLTGRVSSEGSELSELTPRPDGFVQLGPMTIELAEQGESTFQIRLLSGTYSAVVYLFDANGAFRALQPCPSQGCAFSSDTEWPLDVVTTRSAVVEGTVDFVDAAGQSLPPLAASEGELWLELVPDGALALPHGGSGTYIVPADRARGFRHESVAFGTYRVSYRHGDFGSGPFGIFRFDGVLVVDREHVTWRQSATVVPAVIDVTVDQGPMPDDSLLEGEPRGVLFFSEESSTLPPGTDGVSLPLGETGPARFERSMLKGRYRTFVRSQTSYGRTHLRGLEQDVLPIGQLDLGVVELGAASNTAAPTEVSFDLKVRDVSLSVQHTDSLAFTPASPETMISLTSENGKHPFWVHPASVGGQVNLRVYAGCYSVAALPSDLPHYPDRDAHEQEVPVGRLCTCEKAASLPMR
jgi:hypothetical protein